VASAARNGRAHATDPWAPRAGDLRPASVAADLGPAPAAADLALALAADLGFTAEDLGLALGAAPPAQAAAADPLRLDLPPLPGARVEPEALRALGALYLAARLEEVGILPAAEWLARERATLRVPPPTAARLEDLARGAAADVPREQRVQLFARRFGLGPAAAVERTSAGVRFEPLLAALCSALVACGPRPERAAADAAHAAVTVAARDLGAAAAASWTASTALAVTRVTGQLRAAIGLLSDPAVGALVGARGLWATLRALLGRGAPDARRLVDCGRAGQRVLGWVADAAPVLERAPGGGPAVPGDAVASAAAWLGANGLPLPARREGWA